MLLAWKDIPVKHFGKELEECGLSGKSYPLFSLPKAIPFPEEAHNRIVV
jgi:hypothetical protein